MGYYIPDMGNPDAIRATGRVSYETKIDIGNLVSYLEMILFPEEAIDEINRIGAKSGDLVAAGEIYEVIDKFTYLDTNTFAELIEAVAAHRVAEEDNAGAAEEPPRVPEKTLREIEQDHEVPDDIVVLACQYSGLAYDILGPVFAESRDVAGQVRIDLLETALIEHKIDHDNADNFLDAVRQLLKRQA